MPTTRLFSSARRFAAAKSASCSPLLPPMTTLLEEVGGGFAVARALSDSSSQSSFTAIMTWDDCSTNAASSNAAVRRLSKEPVVVITVRLGSRCRSVFKTREFRFDYLTNYMIDGIEKMSFVCWHFLASRILAEIWSVKNTIKTH